MNDALKKSLQTELRLFIGYSLFFTLFFSAFSLLRDLTDNAFRFDSFHFGYNLIESLILAKLILLGQHFHLGEKYKDRSLIIPTLYKTLTFSVFVLIFSIIEEFLLGYLRGHRFEQVIERFLSYGLQAIIGKVLVMSFVFFFFFALLELARVLGEQKLFKLFFKRSTEKE